MFVCRKAREVEAVKIGSVWRGLTKLDQKSESTERGVCVCVCVVMSLIYVSSSPPAVPCCALLSATILAKIRTTSLGIWSHSSERV